jgi:hypothetical protein
MAGHKRIISAQVQEQTRLRIKTTQLVERLVAFSLSENDPQTGKPVRMTRDQIVAALGLLKKTLPDLSAAEITSERTTYVINAPKPIVDADTWITEHSPPKIVENRPN